MVSLLVIKKLEKSYANYVYETKTELLNSSMLAIENKLWTYENSTYQFITSDRVQGYVSQLLEAETNPQQTRSQQRRTDSLVGILKEMDAYLAGANKADAGYFVDLERNIYKAYGGYGYEMQEKDLKKILDGAKKQNGSVYYTTADVLVDDRGNAQKKIVLARTIRERKNLSMRSCGTLIYLVNPQELAEAFLRENDGLVIVDRSGEVIFSSVNEPQQSAILCDLPTDEKWYQVKQVGESKYFLTSLTSKRLGWRYYNVSDYLRLFAFIHTTDLLYTMVLFGILIAIGGLAARLSVNLVRPIVTLSERTKAIRESEDPIQRLSDQGERVMKVRNDEIGQLEQEFAGMARRVSELIHENYEQKLYLQAAQLSALRSNLNPHFLYNTLDTIRWMATEKTYRQIPLLIKALGDILRVSMNSKEPLIAVEQELAYMRGYLTIQRARFGERLNVRIEVQEELMQEKIPAFSLQPLVENAVNYALERIEKSCIIQVTMSSKGENIYCAVADNGLGMDPEIVDKLKLGTIKPQGNGVGLTNLDERLKHLYGMNYGIHVERSVLGGALIWFFVKREVSCENEQKKDSDCR